jgi:hypothetical protein
MAIPSQQIGWSQKSKLLWQISKQLERLTKVTANCVCPTTTTTTTTTPAYRYYNVNGYGCGSCNVVGQFTAFVPYGTPLTIGYFYNNPENTGYSFEILEEIAPVIGAYDLTGQTGYTTCVGSCP